MNDQGSKVSASNSGPKPALSLWRLFLPAVAFSLGSMILLGDSIVPLAVRQHQGRARESVAQTTAMAVPLALVMVYLFVLRPLFIRRWEVASGSTRTRRWSGWADAGCLFALYLIEIPLVYLVIQLVWGWM